MDISGNNNNRTGTLIVVQRKNYLTPITLAVDRVGLPFDASVGEVYDFL